MNTALPPDPEAWFHGATEIAGSWWPDWQRWVSALGKEQVPARVPGDGKLAVIEDAPGSYVKVRAVLDGVGTGGWPKLFPEVHGPRRQCRNCARARGKSRRIWPRAKS